MPRYPSFPHTPQPSKQTKLTPNVGGYLKFSTDEVRKNLKMLDKDILPSAIKKGLLQAALQLYDDTKSKQPYVPWKEGYLRASASVFVQNQLKRKYGMHAADSHVVDIGDNEFIAVLGFNTPYAHKHHQVQHTNYTLPGSGPFYIKVKLETYARDYLAIIVEVIKREMERIRGT